MVGEGTVFTLYLPQAEEAVVADRVVDRDVSHRTAKDFPYSLSKTIWMSVGSRRKRSRILASKPRGLRAQKKL
jgi:hypothetical protein